MSESQRATDLVHSALQALHDLGTDLHAPRGTLAQLAHTSTAPAKSARDAGRPSAVPRPGSATPTASPGPRENPTNREAQRPARDLRAEFAAQMEAAEARPAAKSPAAADRPNNHLAIPGATTIAPATGTKAERLAALSGPVLACTKCPQLVKPRTQVVFGTGDPNAELMFVGEAPGADEDLVGEPFVGRAGQLLTKIIETMGLRRADVYIANILKCRPHMPPAMPGNRKPEPAEMATCKPYLLEQINIVQPRVLVALGGTAVEGLLDIKNAGISRIRGQWREFEGIPLMPTFHPSYLLRPSHDQQAHKRQLWEDMLAVMEKLGRPITEKQRGFFLTKG